MYYPKLDSRKTVRMMTDTFAGYDHRMKIPDGEWYDMQNLTSLRYPMFSPRPKRGTIGTLAEAYSQKKYAVGDFCIHDSKLYQCNTAITTPEVWTVGKWTQKTNQFANLQAIIAKDALYWVDSGTLYANGYAALTGLQTQQETRLVSMGAYICVFPDKKYINTMDLSDYGSMGDSLTLPAGTSLTYSMCHQDGTIYENVTKAATEPEEPSNGDVWIDTIGKQVKEYSVYTKTWVVIETVYTRVDVNSGLYSVTEHFREYDGVQISGLYEDETSTLNGSKILYAVGEDETTHYPYFVIVGIQETAMTQTLAAAAKLERTIPDMTFVCESNNRLWGCFYGNDGTKNINEIYCCALGDFRNWEQYLGVSTDSWRASIGTDGPFTGCINYLGTPTFFKENCVHQVSISSVGAHQINDLPLRGVQQGSHKSLAVVSETLYYKSRTGVMAYQGGMPAEVSEALGEEKYYDAVAGVFGSRYYISMRDAQNAWNLFVYDAARGIWMREDNLHVQGFAWWGDELYAQTGNRILALNGTDGEPETAVDWYAETGIQYYSYPDKKYVSRYNVRLNMARDAKLKIFIEYDSSGIWEYSGTVKLPTTGTNTIPIRPRRCDHLRLRLEGQGDVRIFSIARILEQGSDV